MQRVRFVAEVLTAQQLADRQDKINAALPEMITDLNLCAGIDFAVAESFRREHPELVTERPERTGPPPSMA